MPHPNAVTSSLLLAALMTLGGCSTLQDMRKDLHTPWQASNTLLSIPLSGASQVPPVTTSGTGSVVANMDVSTRLLTWTIHYSGLSGPVTGGHFHGPALPGENAPVVLGFTGNLGSPIQGTATLTPEQAAEFAAGKWYVNLHTAANPGGELRAQIPPKP